MKILNRVPLGNFIAFSALQVAIFVSAGLVQQQTGKMAQRRKTSKPASQFVSFYGPQQWAPTPHGERDQHANERGPRGKLFPPEGFGPQLHPHTPHVHATSPTPNGPQHRKFWVRENNKSVKPLLTHCKERVMQM